MLLDLYVAHLFTGLTGSRVMSRNILLGLGALLIVLWAVAWLLMRVASIAIHIMLGLGVVLLILALVRGVSNRVR
jgi:hypothetical protein